MSDNSIREDRQFQVAIVGYEGTSTSTAPLVGTVNVTTPALVQGNHDMLVEFGKKKILFLFGEMPDSLALMGSSQLGTSYLFWFESGCNIYMMSAFMVPRR